MGEVDFGWVVATLLAVCGFFITLWIHRINEDRKQQEQQTQRFEQRFDERLTVLERDLVFRAEAQRFISRLDRERERLEIRLDELERVSVEKAELHIAITEFKRDINIRFAELRYDFKHIPLLTERDDDG